MPSVTVKKFSGSTPRLAKHLLGDTAAARALDCNFAHGTLDSWREPRLIRNLPEGVNTSVLHDCCWLDFPGCVDIAHGSVGCRELFITGWEEYPVEVTFPYEGDEACIPVISRLGIPCAYREPQVTVGALDPARSSPKDVEGRSYAYQYVNARGRRGALSKGSSTVLVHDGQSVVISGWEIPDASWGITRVAIYRSVAGVGTSMSTISADNQADTVWMFVGEVDINTGFFTDTLYNNELTVGLEEDVVLPPPEGLRGITDISSMNALAGYVGNRIYFSENNSYHNWPYYHDLDDNICGIIENNGIIYVATDGAAYVMPGVSDCKNAGCRQPLRLEQPVYPMVGCGNRRMASLPQGVVYPTHDGLVALSGNNAPVLLTSALYSKEDWHKLLPETVTPVNYGGKLFVFARRGSFVITLAGGSESGWSLDNHSELSDTDVLDAFVTRTGDFYLVKESGIYQWDRGLKLRPHFWESPEWVVPYPISFSVAHAFFIRDQEHVEILVDNKPVLDRDVLSARVIRLPMWACGNRWQVRFTGTASVALFSMATSMKELSS